MHRPVFSREFKLDAVKLATERGVAVALFRHAALAPEVLEEGDFDALLARIEEEVRAHHDQVGVQH